MYIVLLLFLFVYLSSNWQQSVQDLKQWQGMAAFSFYRYTVYLYCIYTSVFVGIYDHMLAPYRHVCYHHWIPKRVPCLRSWQLTSFHLVLKLNKFSVMSTRCMCITCFEFNYMYYRVFIPADLGKHGLFLQKGFSAMLLFLWH